MAGRGVSCRKTGSSNERRWARGSQFVLVAVNELIKDIFD